MPREYTCKQCSLSNDPNVDLYAICEGECAGRFHCQCVKLDEEDLKVLSLNIIWLCDECMDRCRKMRDGRSSSAVKAVDQHMNSDMQNSTIEDDVKELKKAVAGILNALANITPTASTMNPAPPHSTPVSSSMLLNGTNACNTSFEGIEPGQRQQSAIDDNFSLLLSNIDVTVTEKDVHRMVARALGVCSHDQERIDVVKLVSNWRSRKSLDYVSFKVDLDKRWRTKAMNPATWPKRVTFREFIYRQNDTWRPMC